MNEKLRVGVVGLVHDHAWDHLPQLHGSTSAELVGVVDANVGLRDRITEEYGCPVFESFDELTDAGDLDAVYIFLSNAESVDAAVEALDQGLHVMVEKPLASTLQGADEMLMAARRNDRRLMINWPFCWWPQLQLALQLAADGAIGDVWQVKYRAAHAGPKELGCSEFFCEWLFDQELNGGGALMDYCCYGTVLARAILGVPYRVMAMSGRLCKEDILVEDNAIVVMQYPRAMATAEGSWTQVGKLTGYLTAIYGTQGTLLVEPRVGGRLLLAGRDDEQGSEVSLPQSSEEMLNATEHFSDAIATGKPFMPLCRARMARDAQEILEAGLLSVEAQETIDLPLPMCAGEE